VSSSDSDASLGSLPDYDDLTEQQLPTVRQSLLDWLNHPDQPITRETVQNMKQEIKTAKKVNPKQFDEDMKALRKEVKGLMKEFKDRKRVQKIVQKALRKERRAKKKAERKERREAKKEELRKKKGKNKEEIKHFPPWMASKHTASGEDSDTPPMPGGFPFGGHGFGGGFGGPSRGGSGFGGPGARGFPFGRAVSTPVFKPPFTNHHGPSGIPSISAMHGGWPYTQGTAYVQGGISVPNLGGFEPIAHGAESIHQQALQMDREATSKEAVAIRIRTAATSRNVGGKERLKKMDDATALEEEAEKFRREADRLRAEAMHLDLELARELDEENGSQTTGVIGPHGSM